MGGTCPWATKSPCILRLGVRAWRPEPQLGHLGLPVPSAGPSCVSRLASQPDCVVSALPQGRPSGVSPVVAEERGSRVGGLRQTGLCSGSLKGPVLGRCPAGPCHQEDGSTQPAPGSMACPADMKPSRRAPSARSQSSWGSSAATASGLSACCPRRGQRRSPGRVGGSCSRPPVRRHMLVCCAVTDLRFRLLGLDP